MPRVRLSLMWLIGAVALVGLMLVPHESISQLIVQALALIILVPAGLAPRGRRLEAVSWTMVLHPPVLLAYSYLGYGVLWWTVGHQPQVSDFPAILDTSPMFVAMPIILVYVSVISMPLIGFLVLALSQVRSPTPPFPRSLFALPFAWLATAYFVTSDPGWVLAWYWD